MEFDWSKQEETGQLVGAVSCECGCKKFTIVSGAGKYVAKCIMCGKEKQL